MKDIDPAEMAAAKTELKEAMLRRYAQDGRSPASVYGAMTTVTAELLAEMTASAANDEDHCMRLCEIVATLMQTHARKAWQIKQSRLSK